MVIGFAGRAAKLAPQRDAVLDPHSYQLCPLCYAISKIFSQVGLTPIKPLVYRPESSRRCCGRPVLHPAHCARQPGSAWSAGAATVEPLVYLPESASAGKAAKLAALGARLVRVGGDAVEAEVAARAEAERLGATYISPYNDPVASPPLGFRRQTLSCYFASPALCSVPQLCNATA